jgi:Wiskott-Aldrich syndrome protein
MPVNTERVAEKQTGPKLPVIPDTRNALMDSIRKGAQLKKVEATSKVEAGGGRNDLLSEIRGGIELRPVSDRPAGNRSSGDGAGTDALADALRRALELRKTAINGGSSSSTSENSDEGEWSD